MTGLRKTLRRLLRRNKATRPQTDRQSLSTEDSPGRYRFGVPSTPPFVATGDMSNQSTSSLSQQAPTSTQTNHEPFIQHISEINYRELPYFQELPLQYPLGQGVERRDSRSNYSNSIAGGGPDDQLFTASTAFSALPINCLATKQVGEADLNQADKACCAICMENVPPGTIVKSMPCKHWYHGERIKQWLEKERGSCPLCREQSPCAW